MNATASSITLDTTLDHLCNPSLLELQPNLVAAKFDLMKIVPARYILETALKNGDLQPGGLVVESSSGTFALGLAIVCAHYGLRLSLITGPLEPSIRWRLEHLGAEITIVPSAGNTLGGIQQARLNRLRELMNDNPNSFWPRQYTNPLHPAAYKAVATQFSETLGKVDFLVASVGSGSSMGGIAKILRTFNPNLSVIGVDHNLSVLFGRTSGEAYPLCHYGYLHLLGMGSDIVISNLDHSQCDEVHWLPVAPMINAVHELHSKYGLLVGPTAGATYFLAKWLNANYPDKKVLAIFPDHGIRYLNTIFSPQWIEENASELARTWVEPFPVQHPKEVGKDWVYLPWNRRNYTDINGHAPMPR